jgi:hypothetical protein
MSILHHEPSQVCPMNRLTLTGSQRRRGPATYNVAALPKAAQLWPDYLEYVRRAANDSLSSDKKVSDAATLQ